MKARHLGSSAPVNSRVAAFSATSVFPLSAATRALLAAVPMLASGAAFAQSATGVSPTQDVVVTAARVEQKLPDTLPSTSVISRQDIEESPATDLPDLLRTFTSFSVAQTGPLGSQTSVFIRGANSNQVLVLIDGAPLSRADFGSAPWELVPLDQIDHVEVVRGNLSSLYGAQAVGGVVQIFTKHGAGASVAVSGGSYGSFNTSASIGRRLGDAATPLELSAALSGQTTAGFSARDAQADPSANPDRDPAYQGGATFGIGKTWVPGQRTELSFLHSTTHSDYDGFTGTTQQDTLATQLDEFSLRSHHDLVPTLHLDLSAGETLQHFKDPTEALGEFPSSIYGSGRTRLLGAQLGWQVAPDHNLQFQFEDRNERFGEQLDPQVTRQTKSERIGYIGSFFDAVDLQANIRHDDADDYGSANTGLLALGWRISPAWKVVGQVSSAFSAPSFSDIEFAVSPTSLKAEHSRAIEFGVHWTGASWLARATWFSQRQRNLIGFNEQFEAVNIDRLAQPRDRAGGRRRHRLRQAGPRRDLPGSTRRQRRLGAGPPSAHHRDRELPVADLRLGLGRLPPLQRRALRHRPGDLRERHRQVAHDAGPVDAAQAVAELEHRREDGQRDQLAGAGSAGVHGAEAHDAVHLARQLAVMTTPTLLPVGNASGLHAGCRFAGKSLRDFFAAFAPEGELGSARVVTLASRELGIWLRAAA